MKDPRGIVQVALVPAVFVVAVAAAALVPARGSDRANAAAFDALRHGPGVVNHPVGVVPSARVRIPAGWPLRADGTLTCLTCHASLPDLESSGDAKLRGNPTAGDAAGNFCVTCHGGSWSDNSRAMHWMALTRAHIPADNDAEAYAGGRDGLDRESRRCLECHDGVTARDGSVGGKGMADPGTNHPVGIEYATGRDAEVTLRSPSELPHSVRLPGGRVSCVSCHNLYAGHDRLLTVPLERSTLCFTCHRLDP